MSIGKATALSAFIFSVGLNVFSGLLVVLPGVAGCCLLPVSAPGGSAVAGPVTGVVGAWAGG